MAASCLVLATQKPGNVTGHTTSNSFRRCEKVAETRGRNMLKTIGSIALIVVAVPAFALGSGAGHGGSQYVDVTTLIPKATKMVRAKAGFSRAVLLEADGSPMSGKVVGAAGITKWRFVFNNQATKGFNFRSAALYYKNGKFGRFVAHRDPFVEDRNIASVPKMTLVRAVKKLRAAGHRNRFGAVTLRYPLGPGFKEPLYIFGFGSGDYWTVGTRTGKVKPLS
jgi:hypothetical protein